MSSPDQSLDPTLTELGDALEQGAAGRSRPDGGRTGATPRALAPEHAGARDRRRSPADRGAGYRDRRQDADRHRHGTRAACRPERSRSLGTDPTCTVVTEGVEYHCILAHVPAPEVQDWKGTVEPTVDDTSHVNGGCRSLRSDGLEWQCYLGETAVDEQIIGQGFLGEYSSGPGVG